MSYTQGSIAWRLPLALQIIFACIVIVLLFGLPESPRWLFAKKRDQEAVDVLCLVHEEDPNGKEVAFQVRQIREALSAEAEDSGFTWRKPFRGDKLHTLRRIILAWGVQVGDKRAHLTWRC